ncbi:MAG: EscU/YscU/HrcU family type III secretion system export apparatus switch protein [Verrucomicrobia bacterium]|nr:EscU/YscU/HrcU family type III secretion system export apparatus switch protein [Verrucomicrobiota bacterium]
MAEEQDKSSKTEQPSVKRLDEARKSGNFARAEEVQVVFGLMAAFIVLFFYAKNLGSSMAMNMQGILSNLGEFPFNRTMVITTGRDGLAAMLFLISPVCAAGVFAGILGGGLQSGFRLSPKALKFKGKKLNPINGIKEKYGKQAYVKFCLDLLKLLAIGGVITYSIFRVIQHPIFYTRIEILDIGRFLLEATLYILALLILAMGLIALIHFLYQKQKVHKDLMMTRQEVKDETKQQEGDHTVKSARRQLAHRLMERQMFAAIPGADVVVTNPTHYAVALRYNRSVDSAPMVLAKGRNLIAQNIKRIAREHGVPIIENKPAAQALYKIGQTGKPIPPQVFKIVAEVLAYVYRTHRNFFAQRKRTLK